MSASDDDPNLSRLARYYDGIAYRYEVEVYNRVQRYSERVLAFLQEVPQRAGTRILDVGCGPGILTRDVAPEVEVVGFDLSTEMTRLAQCGRPGGAYHVHDFHQPLPAEWGLFDVVLAVGCLEFCGDLALVIGHLARVARPGGRMLLTVVERDRDEADGRAGVPISPKLPGVMMYRYTYDEVACVLGGLGLRVREHRRHPGWLKDDELVEYGIWDLLA
jgi:SAM-dependent methyltransferase